MTETENGGKPITAGRNRLRALARVMRPVMTVVAIVYFLIDAIFIAALRPIGRAIARLAMFSRLADWAQTVNPYLAFVLLAVPLALLEPAKPIGLYLMASGHLVNGVLVIGGAEIVKIMLVERMFHVFKDRLMTIPAFAWGYTIVTSWIARLQSTAAWQAVAMRVAAIKKRARLAVLSLRRLLRSRSHG